METKKCSKCQKGKYLAEFGRNKGYRDGYDAYCRECRGSYNKNYQRNYRKRICSECGELMGVDALRCISCRQREIQERRRNKIEARRIERAFWELFNPEPICSRCGITTHRKSKSLCQKCYYKDQPKEARQRKSKSIEALWKQGHYDGMLIRIRQEPTDLELDLAQALGELGLDHVPQYRPDSCSYAYDEYVPILNLLIEVDGEHWHHSAWAESQGVPEKDAAKDQWAAENDYHLIRIRGRDIRDFGIEACLLPHLSEQLEF